MIALHTDQHLALSGHRCGKQMPRDKRPAGTSASMTQRLRRVAELARGASGLSKATRAGILARVDDLLQFDDSSNKRRSTVAGRERSDNRLASQKPSEPCSAYERLKRLEQSVVIINRTFQTILSLTRRASECLGGPGEEDEAE